MQEHGLHTVSLIANHLDAPTHEFVQDLGLRITLYGSNSPPRNKGLGAKKLGNAASEVSEKVNVHCVHPDAMTDRE